MANAPVELAKTKGLKGECHGGVWASVADGHETTFMGMTVGSSVRHFKESLFFCCPRPGYAPVCRKANWQLSSARAPSGLGSGAATTPSSGSAQPTKTGSSPMAGAITTNGMGLFALPAPKVASLRKLVDKRITLGGTNGRQIRGTLLSVEEPGLKIKRRGPTGEAVVFYGWNEVKWVK